MSPFPTHLENQTGVGALHEIVRGQAAVRHRGEQLGDPADPHRPHGGVNAPADREPKKIKIKTTLNQCMNQ